jgi:hypothetical protein
LLGAQQSYATTHDLLHSSAWRAVRLQRGLFSFISTSTIATPPANLATRSCSFHGRSRWGFFDLNAHLFHAGDVSSSTGTVDDDGVFCGFNALGLAQISQRHFSSDMPTSSAMTLPPVRQAIIFQRNFAAVAEA